MELPSKSALVVDADLNQRKSVAGALATAGFHCETAENGKEALKLLRATNPELLVTDVLLPEMHGHALIVAALELERVPRMIVRSDLVDGRIVRDMLARGVDDYLHRAVPNELLVTKARSLFELSNWQAGLLSAHSVKKPEMSDEHKFTLLERQLKLLSSHYARQFERSIKEEVAIPDVPTGLLKYVQRLNEGEVPHEQKSIFALANTRGAQRFRLQTVAAAIQINDQFEAVDNPTNLVLMDVSARGVRLMHTRSISASDLMVEWDAVTIPDYQFRLPITVTRCRPKGRFYDIGGQFDIPALIQDDMKELENEAMLAIS